MAWQVLNAINDGDIDTLIRISMNVRGVTRVVLLLCTNTICAFSVSHRNSSHGTLWNRSVSSAAHVFIAIIALVCRLWLTAAPRSAAVPYSDSLATVSDHVGLTCVGELSHQSRTAPHRTAPHCTAKRNANV